MNVMLLEKKYDKIENSNIINEKEVLLILKKMWSGDDVAVEISTDNLSRVAIIAEYKGIKISGSVTMLRELGMGDYTEYWSRRSIEVNGELVYYMTYGNNKYLNIIFNKFLFNISNIESKRRKEALKSLKEKERKKVEKTISEILL
ncbi:MAG: hypothetical protein ACRDD8_16300 [Bacteroidales bacterium]